MKYRYEIATAGLIHDIGKLYQKSTSSSLYRSKSYEHPLIAGDFVDKFKSDPYIWGLKVIIPKSYNTVIVRPLYMGIKAMPVL